MSDLSTQVGRNKAADDVFLPEAETFSPPMAMAPPPRATAAVHPAAPQPVPPAPMVDEPANVTYERAPQPIIGHGGYTLAVPGAENMDVPFKSAAVSTATRPVQSTPLISVISDAVGGEEISRKVKSPIGLTVAAALMLTTMVGGTTWMLSGGSKENTLVASQPTVVTPTLVEEPDLQGRATARIETKPEDEEGALKPRRVKVETIRLSPLKKLPEEAASLREPLSVDKLAENDAADEARDILVRFKEDGDDVAAVAIPRPKPVLSASLEVEPVKQDKPNLFNVHASTGSFLKELAALRDGTRVKPLTIVHMGDSHIASDAFTRGIRSGLQKAFGDAGRGAVLPAKAFKYTRADGVKMTTAGIWSSASSLTTKTGPYGISGVRVWSSSTSSKMTMTSLSNAFDWAEVTVLTGPKQGKVRLTVGADTKVVNASAPDIGSKVVRIKARGKKLVVNPAGGGRTTVLNWATGRDVAGIRYVNFGIVSATAYLQKRWHPKLVANDIRHLNPDLVVWGYGTNEGFNSNLDMKAYRRQVASIYSTVSAAAPKADWLFLGPASGLSKRGKAAAWCNGYRVPLKLGAVRDTLKGFAKENDRLFWDWASAMGGNCAIDRWARSSPKLALSDRVHLNRAGYLKSANALVAHIKKLVDEPQVVASVDRENFEQ